MSAPALMRLNCVIEANTWPLAAATLITKMGGVCPGMPFEVTGLVCDPAPETPNKPRLIGPPWRFTIDIQLTTLI